MRCACHARGRVFKSNSGRECTNICLSVFIIYYNISLLIFYKARSKQADGIWLPPLINLKAATILEVLRLLLRIELHALPAFMSKKALFLVAAGSAEYDCAVWMRVAKISVRPFSRSKKLIMIMIAHILELTCLMLTLKYLYI